MAYSKDEEDKRDKKDEPAQKTQGIDGTTAEKVKTKMTKPKKALVIVACVFLALVLLVYFAYTIIANQISGENTQAGTLPQEVKTLPEYTGKGIITGLICGIDYGDEDGEISVTSASSEKNAKTDNSKELNNEVGQTDLILYFIFDTEKNKLKILQIPRDVYVGDKLATGGTGKINALYKSSKDENNRVAALATTLYNQFRLPVDFYVTIDMQALKEIIDIKGSINVFVPVEVNYPGSDSVIYPGWRAFNGEQAEFFLRNRKSDTYKEQGDIMRLQMQQNFYSAIYREFKQLAPLDLVMWMRVVLYRCDTDMDPIQLGGLAQKALRLEGKDITFVRPSAGGTELFNEEKNRNEFVLILEPEEMQKLLNEYFRPEGQLVDAKELDIKTLPIDPQYGVSPVSIREMADIQKAEDEAALALQESENESKAA